MLLLSCDIWPHLLMLAALLHIMVTIAGALTQQVLVAQPCVVHELCEHRFHWPSLCHDQEGTQEAAPFGSATGAQTGERVRPTPA